MSSATTPTPLPPDCDQASPASAWNRTIGVLSLPSWSSKIVELQPEEAPSPLGRTIFASSIEELSAALQGERRPLALIHADSLAAGAVEEAKRICALPCEPVVAALGRSDQMQAAFGVARRLGLKAIFPDDCLQYRRELLRWANWMERGGPPRGIAPHLENGSPIERVQIKRLEDKGEAIERILAAISEIRRDQQFLFDLRLILEEAINNALFHAFHAADGSEKYSVDGFRSLGSGESVEAAWGADTSAIAVSVTDNQGRLTGETIVAKIERHLGDEGVLDQNGRGLYLTYSLAGRLIFNIERGKMTQLAALFPITAEAWHESPPLRPLLIFERG